MWQRIKRSMARFFRRGAGESPQLEFDLGEPNSRNPFVGYMRNRPPLELTEDMRHVEG